MTRLDDVLGELETTLGRLKREARQAQRYKKLAAEIRALQAGVAYARWKDAALALERVEAEAHAAGREVEETAGAAAAASTAQTLAEAAVGPLREEAQVAGAVLHRLAIENDRLERETEAAAAAVRRLAGEIARLEADPGAGRPRPRTMPATALGPARHRRSSWPRSRARSPARPSCPARTWRPPPGAPPTEDRVAAEGRVESLGHPAFGIEDAGRRAIEARLDESRGRLARTGRALDAASADRAQVGGGAPDPATA